MHLVCCCRRLHDILRLQLLRLLCLLPEPLLLLLHMLWLHVHSISKQPA